jgi:hypothetical protein
MKFGLRGTRGVSRVLTLLLAALPVSAQLPPSGTLSPSDWPSFRAAVADLEKRLPAAPDKCAITYEIARTYASAKQWRKRWIGSAECPT